MDKRIFIVWTHPLGHESVRLLLNHPDVEIVGSTADYTTALKDIAHLQPDTVIIEEIGSGVPTKALSILEASPWVTRIIGFSLTDNKLSVYHREEKTVGRAEDLLHLIQSD